MELTVRHVLHQLRDDPGIAVKYQGRQWTWREHLAEARTSAAALIGVLEPDKPAHVGVLLGNTPTMLTQMAAAGLGGYVLCGVNNTRRGAALGADIRRADCQVLVTDAEHRPLLDGVDLGAVRVIDTSTDDWHQMLSAADDLEPLRSPELTDTFMLIFTSGTSGDPKAVQVSNFMVVMAGQALVQRFALTGADTCYLSMPLFHSNAVVAGWAVALCSGAAMAPAKFTASGFLPDIRSYGATYMNYVGKPLAFVLGTPESPDDADNPLRVAFGNEASDRDIEEFSRRFDTQVWDGFGSTENAVIITREPGTPPGSVGKGFEGVAIYDSESVTECAVARFDSDGALANPDEAIGELVNTQGSGMFGGYYNDPGATAERTRGGMYWSGDLAYRDADGWIYLAGRTGDWMRVDGENLAAAPIERILLRLPQLNRVAVYGVPDEYVGDQVMASIVLHDGASLTAEQLAEFLAAQPDLSPKAWPRYVRIATDLPSTATHKVLKRALAAQGSSACGGILFAREARGTVYSVEPQ